MNGMDPGTQIQLSLKVTGSRVLRKWVEFFYLKAPWHGVRVVLEDLGSAGEEGVKCLCTSAGHQISRVQVLPGRGGARLAPGPLSSLGPG